MSSGLAAFFDIQVPEESPGTVGGAGDVVRPAKPSPTPSKANPSRKASRKDPGAAKIPAPEGTRRRKEPVKTDDAPKKCRKKPSKEPKPAEDQLVMHARFTPLPTQPEPAAYEPLDGTALFESDRDDDDPGDPVAPPDDFWEADADEDDALESETVEDDALETDDEGSCRSARSGFGDSLGAAGESLGESLGESSGEPAGRDSMADVVDALGMMDRMGMASTDIMRRVAGSSKTRSFFRTRRPRPNACQAGVVYAGPRLCREPL